MVVPKCTSLHFPLLYSTYFTAIALFVWEVSVGYSLGPADSWGGCSLSQQKGEALCLGYVKSTGLQLSLPEIFDWATSLTEISPMAPAV